MQEYKYGVFGEILSQSGSIQNPLTYTAREWDEDIELYYYRARFYDAKLGRFLSEDPIGFNSGDYNHYRYVFNSPVIFIDPSGLLYGAFTVTGGTGKFGGTVSINISKSGISVTGGLGIGIGFGTSVTINSGNPDPGTNVSLSVTGGNGVVGGTFSAGRHYPGEKPSGGFGIGWGVGYGASFTGAHTWNIIDFNPPPKCNH